MDKRTPQDIQKRGADAREERAYLFLAFRIIGELGAVIAIPAVALSLAGKWLDGRYGTSPFLTICGFAVAAVITSVSIARKARAFAREYDAIGKKRGTNEERR